MILDSLGELLMLRGELDEAEGLSPARGRPRDEHGNKWYACQALQNPGPLLSGHGRSRERPGKGNSKLGTG